MPFRLIDPSGGGAPAVVKSYTEVDIETQNTFGTATPNLVSGISGVGVFGNWYLIYEKAYITNLFALYYYSEGTEKDGVIQMGTGPNGAETVIGEISLRTMGQYKIGALSVNFFPYEIPANTKLKMRVSTVGGTVDYKCGVNCYKTLENDLLSDFVFSGFVKETSAFGAGTPNLVTIAKPAVANTFSNYYTLINLNAENFLNSVYITTNPNLSSLYSTIELASGAIGAETVFMKTDLCVDSFASGYFKGNYFYIPIPKKFAANTRISARIADNNAAAINYQASAQALTGL